MTRHRWFLVPLLALGILLATGSAAAQTLTRADAEPQRPKHEEGGNPDNLLPKNVNHSDCVADDIFRFPVTVTGAAGLATEVWAGPGCTTLEQRQGTSATCWQVYDQRAQTGNVDIRVQDIIAGDVDLNAYTGPGSGTSGVCDTNEPIEKTVSLHFFLINSADELPEGFVEPPAYEVFYRMVGPNPPTNVDVGVGEESLVLDFDAPEDDDINLDKYYLYCAPAGSVPSGSGGTTGAAGADGAGGAPDDTGSGGTTQTPTTSNCPSSALVAGELPPEQFREGTIERLGTSGQTDEDLENGVTYVCGVAAVDTYGNPGPLSELVCGTPESINGFFEEYRAAGGQGGGGFCSIGNAAHSGLPWLAAASLALAAVLRRRAARGGPRS